MFKNEPLDLAKNIIFFIALLINILYCYFNNIYQTTSALRIKIAGKRICLHCSTVTVKAIYGSFGGFSYFCTLL